MQGYELHNLPTVRGLCAEPFMFFPVSVISKTIFEMIFRIFEFDFFPTLLNYPERIICFDPTN